MINIKGKLSDRINSPNYIIKIKLACVMFYFHGKQTVGKIPKCLEEFTVRGCRTVTPSKKTINIFVV